VASRRWVWSQHWTDLLFLHWRVAPAAVQHRLPTGLEVETRDGSAWVSFVLFRLKVRPCGLPFVPGLSSLTEVNLRTYVTCGDATGVHFLGMHADNPWSARLARLCTPLPYQAARLSYRRVEEGFRFDQHGGARLHLTFRPTGPARLLHPFSLDGWLLERYRAFCGGRAGITTALVSHPPWAVRDVELHGSCAGDTWWPHAPPGPPDRMHFADGVHALFGPFRQVEACIGRRVVQPASSAPAPS
jgi:uncharacterized protein YqjF (DUF2071 family)